MDSAILCISSSINDLTISTSPTLQQHDASLTPSPTLSNQSPLLQNVTVSRRGDQIECIRPTYRKNAFRIEGHRGSGRYAPENTYQAFTRAIESQIEGIELDVWLTSDQVPVIIHTSGGVVTFDDDTKMVVTESTFEQLRSKTILNNNVIPTLEEVLRITRGKICVNVEFKGTDLNGAEICLKAIKEEGMLEQVHYSSFNWKFYGALKTAAQKLDITERIYFGFLADDPEVIDENMFLGQAGDGITIPYTLIQTHRDLVLDISQKAKERGFNIKVYFSFKTPETFEVYHELESLGFETVITNEPDLAKQYFEMEHSRHRTSV